MEEKALAKDEKKSNLRLAKILEIEEAYSDLMKAYSSCLTHLNVKETDFYINKKGIGSIYKPSWLTPKMVRYRIGQHVNFLREVFLSLIAQNRGKYDSKITKKIELFELYCEDMNKLSIQVQETGFKTMFYDTPGAIPALIPAIILILTTVLNYPDYNIPTLPLIVLVSISVTLGFIFLVSVFGFLSIVCSARKSSRVLTVTGVQEKQKTIFNLLQEYLECV